MDRRRRPKTHGGVHIVDAKPGRTAVGIGNARLHADAVALFQGRDLGAGLDHDTGSLVAEDHRVLDDERPDAAVGVVVNVRSTNADGVQLDAHIARAEVFLDAIDVGKVTK